MLKKAGRGGQAPARTLGGGRRCRTATAAHRATPCGDSPGGNCPVFYKFLIAAAWRSPDPKEGSKGAGSWLVTWESTTEALPTSLKLPFLLELTRNFWSRTKLDIFFRQVTDGVGILQSSLPTLNTCPRTGPQLGRALLPSDSQKPQGETTPKHPFVRNTATPQGTSACLFSHLQTLMHLLLLPTVVPSPKQCLQVYHFSQKQANKQKQGPRPS